MHPESNPAPAARPTSAQAAQKFYIKTFGCQMNVADSERMAALLAEQGMTPADEVEDAHVIILNGCTVREKAVHKAISTLGSYHKAGRKNAIKPVIGIGGCVGQLEKEQLFKQAPYLDFVFGTDTIDNLPEIVNRVQNGEKHVVFADFDKSMDYSTETKVHGHKAQAFVNIMKGCDKYCSYCIVPFTRGREKSRTIDEVVFDVARLVAGGVREVTLLGQNVNSFGKGNENVKKREPQELNNIIGKVGPRAGEENFPQLLRAIDQDPRCVNLKRIRFTSSHPLDFSDELINCYATPEKGGVAKLSPHLHLPVQSGSNRVLQKMGRHHRIEHYFAQMERLRELNPEVGITTDLIVGFPTETEEEFEETIKLLDRVQYYNIFAFAYSPRPGTRAAKLPDDVPDSVKNERLNRLLQHQLEISGRNFAECVGKTYEILVEGEARNQNLVEKNRVEKNRVEKGTAAEIESGAKPVAAGGRVWMGRTGCNRVVNFVSDSNRNLLGKFFDVKIIAASRLSLQGELVVTPTFAEDAANAKVEFSNPMSALSNPMSELMTSEVVS
ncbi:MAG: tRNA (N6-isopentenyl adenosine(37)-C2)-methylthiotransferase MiaB [Methylotenera sp.]|nr:tRNA (N6-isopentenyl adenosine(37)-C2)-methylthiotransferase MiaB [Oligoflexia bacterium]